MAELSNHQVPTITNTQSLPVSTLSAELYGPIGPESLRIHAPTVRSKISGQRSKSGVAQVAINHEDALKRELAQKKLLEVPGLTEHLFSDAQLEQHIAHVAQNIWNSSNVLWNASTSRWPNCPNLENNIELSGDSSSRVGLAESMEKMSAFLNTISDEIYELFQWGSKTTPRRRWTATWTADEEASTSHASPGQQGPRLCLIEETTSPPESPTWKKVLVTVAFSPAENDHPVSLTQLAYNARMVFYNQDDRRFFTGISFAAMQVRVCVFDRSGVVGSQPFNMHTQPDRFVHLLAGLLLCQREDIGLDPNVYVDTLSGQRFVQVAKVRYEILETIFISDALVGSGTVCWRARRAIEGCNEENKEVVIKSIWVDEEGGLCEKDIMDMVGDIEGVVNMVASEVVLVNEEEDTTDRIRIVIQDSHPDFYKMNNIDIRALHRLVLSPYAQEITTFCSERELLSVFIDGIQAHMRLLNKGVLHHDISLENIMIYDAPRSDKSVCHAEETPMRRGLLIDLGCAIQVPEGPSWHEIKEDPPNDLETSSEASRDAVEDLDGFESKIDQDLQAFLFILIWICWYFPGPRNSLHQDFTGLNEGLLVASGNLQDSDSDAEWEDIGIFKFAPMCVVDEAGEDTFKNVVLRNFSPYFQDLKACVTDLRRLIFGRGKTKVTHDEMVAVLKEACDILPLEDHQLPKATTARHPLSPDHGAHKRKRRKLKENDGNFG